MEVKNFKITSQLQGLRLDKALQLLLENSSRAFVQNLLESNAVTLNGKAAKKSVKVQAGDELKVVIPEPELLDVVAENIPIDIVYEDDDLLVVNKTKDTSHNPYSTS